MALLALAASAVYFNLHRGRRSGQTGEVVLKVPVAAARPAAGFDGEMPFDADSQEAAAEQALAAYEQFAVYPPWSRPADASQQHLIDWNGGMPVEVAVATGELDQPAHVEVFLDRFFAAPGESLTATVKVDGMEMANRVSATGEIQISRAEGMSGAGDTDGGWQSLQQPLRFVREPRDPEVQRLRFTPGEVATLDETADARLLVRVEGPGGTAAIPLAFRYAQSMPLEVLGIRNDRIRRGSLEVALDVDILYLGPVLIQAALFDASGREPIAVFDAYRQPRQAGRQELKIMFFGRAIRESGVNGPYSIRALHGIVRVGDAQLFWSVSPELPLLTNAYRADEFDDAEWRSPDKRRKIRQYQNFLAGLRAQRSER